MSKRRQRALPLCCFANPKSQPLLMDNFTWQKEMNDLERIIYAMFKKNFPKPFSPETLFQLLSRRFEDLCIADVWRCLDSKVMQRFLFRKTRFFWFLITEQQLQAYQAQFQSNAV